MNEPLLIAMWIGIVCLWACAMVAKFYKQGRKISEIEIDIACLKAANIRHEDEIAQNAKDMDQMQKEMNLRNTPAQFPPNHPPPIPTRNFQEFRKKMEA